MPLLLWILGGLGLLWLVSGGYIFVVGCVRTKETDWLDEKSVSKTAFARYGENIRLADGWLKAHHAEEVSIQSTDGLQLKGYWVPAENAIGTILLAHGYRSSFLLDFGAAFAYYHDLGFNILVPSQRSHGGSQGKLITFGVKESDDFYRWILFHNETFGNFPLILSGMSMGASTVLYLADRQLPENVKGIIADCGFTSPAQILSAVYRSVIRLPASPSIRAADLFARVFGGFSLFEKDTRKILSQATVPVLMIHGSADDFVPCAMTKAGYAACSGKKALLIVEGAGHGVSFLHAPEIYSRKVLAFLKDVLEEDPL